MIGALWLLACRSTTPVAPLPTAIETPPPSEEVRDALYFVLVDRFANGTPDPAGTVDPSDPAAWHGGDLQGVIDRLDHLQDLGVGGVWLSPINQTRTQPLDAWGAFHGYWVEDLAAIEPRMGTLAQARHLSEALRERDMGLWLDMVYNHVGYDAPRTRTDPEWFHHNGDIVDWTDPVQVVTHDVHGLPDLAQEREAVRAHLLDASRFWLQTLQPAGFRVDAVRHLPEGFLADLGAALRADTDGEFQWLGEVFEGDVDALAARQQIDALDRVFDFPLHYAMKDVFCSDAPPGRIASTLSQDRAYRDAHTLVTFLDNHDVPRILTACGGDRSRVARALAFLIASRGSPCLTYGTEAGLTGAEEPANRADMVFDGDGSDPSLYALVKALLTLRATSPSWRDGQTRIEHLTDHTLALTRTVAGEQTWIWVNQSDQALPIPPHALSDAQVSGWMVADAEVPAPLGSAVPPGAVGLRRIRHPSVQPAAPVDRPSASVQGTVTATLQPGDRLFVVGAGARLGRWTPTDGIEVTDGRFDLQAFPSEVLAFKLVIQHADGQVSWEPGPNRTPHIPAEGTTLDLHWNAPKPDLPSPSPTPP